MRTRWQLALALALALAGAPAYAGDSTGSNGGAGSSSASDIVSGTTTITGGTDTSPCFDDGGIFNCSDAGWSFNKTTNALTASSFVGALTGNASTSTAFAATPTKCLAGNYPLGVDASGNAADCTAAGVGTVTGTGTTGLNATWTSASALGDATNFPISVPNDSGTGTTVNKLAKFTSSGTAIITGAAETAGILGVVKDGAGTTGSAKIVTLGSTSCISDNATTAGHYAGVSASTAGSCTNLGATFPASGTQVIGTWTETGIAGTRTLFFGTPDVASASSGGGGGGSKNPAGAAGDVQYRASTNAFAAETDFNWNATDNRLRLSNLTTATDNTTRMIDISGTLPASPSTSVLGPTMLITSAGSASFQQRAAHIQFAAGYTGTSATAGLYVTNLVNGRGTADQLARFGLQNDNVGLYAESNNTPAVTGTVSIGVQGGCLIAPGANVGTCYGMKGTGYQNGTTGSSGLAVGGAFIGITDSATGPGRLGIFAGISNDKDGFTPSDRKSAAQFKVASTGPGSEDSIIDGYLDNTLTFTVGTTGIVNVITGGKYQINATDVLTATTLGSGVTASSLTSVGTLTSVASSGTITSSRTTDLGWTPVAAANQACNTTCTSACVVGIDTLGTGGFLACTDATADSCLCAGGS